ncbi:hypothetical protein FA13DRAFT_1710243 [Coprinellus micaceus]|uniref:Uncharacterized protein n=1 Tax=Coprinellus micaceus TaxID=71717 RepID=A0A4Y7T8U3_COPMI|nr:hypothetical protein FA13DRAFT_1710243 [Coprinellus micaceus]
MSTARTKKREYAMHVVTPQQGLPRLDLDFMESYELRLGPIYPSDLSAQVPDQVSPGLRPADRSYKDIGPGVNRAFRGSRPYCPPGQAPPTVNSAVLAIASGLRWQGLAPMMRLSTYCATESKSKGAVSGITSMSNLSMGRMDRSPESTTACLFGKDTPAKDPEYSTQAPERSSVRDVPDRSGFPSSDSLESGAQIVSLRFLCVQKTCTTHMVALLIASHRVRGKQGETGLWVPSGSLEFPKTAKTEGGASAIHPQ